MSGYPQAGPYDPLAPPRLKSGCWTCRIRRKKCTLDPDAEGNCGECRRLAIPCTGWGEKRADWIKDPQKLESFKRSIKKQLMSRSGSRTSTTAPTVASSSNAANSSRAPGSSYQASAETSLYPLDSSMIGFNPTSMPPPPPPQRDMMFDYPQLSNHLLQLAVASGVQQPHMQFIFQLEELARWKNTQNERGILSYRELARRGRAVEDLLLGERSASHNASRNFSSDWPDSFPETSGDQGSSTPITDVSWSEHSFGGSFSGDMHTARPSIAQQQYSMDPNAANQFMQGALSLPGTSRSPAQSFNTPPMMYPGGVHQPMQQYPAGFHTSPPQYDPNLNILSASPPQQTGAPSSMPLATPPNQKELIHREACLLLLHTIISGPNPRVPEIETGVRNLSARFAAWHSSEHNNASGDLAFPASVGACLSNPSEREGFFVILASVAVPTISASARALIDDVVARRNAHEETRNHMYAASRGYGL